MAQWVWVSEQKKTGQDLEPDDVLANETRTHKIVYTVTYLLSVLEV